jgi:hypothetical protein
MFVSFFLVLIEKTFCKLELAPYHFLIYIYSQSMHSADLAKVRRIIWMTVQSLLESISARNKEREVSLGFTHLDDVLV